MKKNLLWKAEEAVMKGLMIAALAVVVGCLLLILTTVVWRGMPAMNLAMLIQSPKGGYYTGAEGGILNAILGSLYLALGGGFSTWGRPPESGLTSRIASRNSVASLDLLSLRLSLLMVLVARQSWPRARWVAGVRYENTAQQ